MASSLASGTCLGSSFSKRAARQNYGTRQPTCGPKSEGGAQPGRGWVFHHGLLNVSSVIAPVEGASFLHRSSLPRSVAATTILKRGPQLPGNWSIGAKSTDRIDARRATRRKICGEHRDRDHERAGCGQRDHVTRLDAEKITANG